MDVLHTLGVPPICNQFWHYPLCDVYPLWHPDELPQLLLGSVRGLLHWLFKCLDARVVEDQFDNRFTSVSQYPGLQHCCKPFDSLKSGTWQGKEIQGMIRTLAENCAIILDCFQCARKTASESASDETVMGVVQALCEFYLLVSQHNYSNPSFTALDHAQRHFYNNKGAFGEHKMSKSGKVKVDELLVTESHQLQQQMLHKIRAASDVPLYGASVSNGYG